jgi:hypothetical protein
MNCYLLVMSFDFKTCVSSHLLLSAQKWCLFLNPHFPKNKYVHHNQSGIWKQYYKSNTWSCGTGAVQVGLGSSASYVKLLEK